MDFATARREYNLLKRAFLTGAITQEEFYQKIDTELEVTADDGTAWKIDEDTGVWMVYVVDEETWVEMPAVYPEAENSDEQIAIKLDVPTEAPKVPAEVYRDWKTQIKSSPKPETRVSPIKSPQPSESGGNKGKESSALCQACGQENRPGTKFCTRCGQATQQSTQQHTHHCPNCKKELQPGNKFCTGCGQKVDIKAQ